jgi:hypothetical protein
MGYLTGQPYSEKLNFSYIYNMPDDNNFQPAELMLCQNIGLDNIISRNIAVRNNIKPLDVRILLLINGFGSPIVPGMVVKTKVREINNTYVSIIALEAAGLIERKKRIKTEATKIHITEAGVKVVRSYLVALARLRRQHYNI